MQAHQLSQCHTHCQRATWVMRSRSQRLCPQSRISSLCRSSYSDNQLIGHGGDSSGNGGNSPPAKRLGGSDEGGDAPDHQSWWLRCSVASAVGLHQLVFASPAAAAKPAKQDRQATQTEPQFGDIDSYIEQAWLFIGPALTKLGWSGMLGMAAASGLKFLGRALLTLAGFTFVVVQGLNYAGVIPEVRWSELTKHVTKRLDPEGKKTSLDAEDVKALAKKGLTALTEGVPSVGGFLAGFTLGMRFL